MSAGGVIGPYRVVRELGRGGAGVVYEVALPDGERPLALKLLHAGRTSPEAVARFGREALLLAQVRHPSVVRVLDLQRTPQGDPYLVTELVPGDELTDVRKHGPLGWERCAEVVRALADALDTLHAQGIVHRDLKPQNVILHEDGHPVLLDFGLARGHDEGERLTQSGAFLGTPAYVAPEQAESAREVGPAADVYSLGAILFFLLSGRAPYAGTLGEVLSKLLRDVPPTWPSADDPEVPLELEGVCKRAMRMDPAERTPTAAALRDELDAYLQGEGQAEPERRGWALALASAAALALAVSLWAVLGGRGEQASPATPPPPSAAEVASGSPAVAERAPPSSGDLDAARSFSTVASVARRGAELPNAEALTWAVHYRNAREPLWTGTHHVGLVSEANGGRLVPPRAVFPNAGRVLVTYGGKAHESSYEPAPALAWDLGTRKQLAELTKVTTGPTNAVLPVCSPRRSGVHTLTGVLGFNTWNVHVRAGQIVPDWDATDMGLSEMVPVLAGLPAWTSKGKALDDKPVTAVGVSGDLEVFALGTGKRGGRKGNYVFRFPYPVALEGRDRAGETLRADCAEVKISSGPVRSLAFAPAPTRTLWALGSRELYRWAVGAPPERVGRPATSWWDVHVDEGGRAWAVGAAGCAAFAADGQRLGDHPLPGFAGVDGVEGLGAQRALVVGVGPEGRGAWACLRLPEDGSAPEVISAGRGDFPYADVAVGAREGLACFTRWDGEFEVWDLAGLLPYGAQPLPAPGDAAAPAPTDQAEVDVDAAATRYRGRPRAVVDRDLPPTLPARRAILDAVSRANTERPLWTGRHAELSPDPDRPPRATFLAGGEFVTWGGRQAEGGAPASPKRWPPVAGEPRDLLQGAAPEVVAACSVDPRWPRAALLWRTLQDAPLRRDPEGSELLPGLTSVRATWPPALAERLQGPPKPLSCAVVAPGWRELFLGARAAGTPEGSAVLRVPLRALEPVWFLTPWVAAEAQAPGRDAFEPAGAQLSPPLPDGEAPLRVVADPDAVWILDRRGVIRWRGEEVTRVLEPPAGSRWRDLLVLEAGRYLLLGGDRGLTLVQTSALGRPIELDQDVLPEVRALYVFPNPGKLEHREQLFLIVGSKDGAPVWATVQVDLRNVEQVLVRTGAEGAPYVDVAPSADGQLACLLRADGSFEVWDLASLRIRSGR